MQVDRHLAYVPRARVLGEKLMTLTTPCVGCVDCRGLCDTLLELLTLPEAILDRDRVG